MIRTTTVRYALICASLVLLACGEDAGGDRDFPLSEVQETTRGEQPMNQAEQDRRIDYVEFSATDIEETKQFYSEVFGWEFTDYGPDYTSFMDGRLAGGFKAAASVAAGGPLIVIYATDLAAIEARVRDAGGTIVREVFEFPGGRRFHFTDPSGTELAVWSDR
jgi:predicted enzyme related to lactoylglutathione lyase